MEDMEDKIKLIDPKITCVPTAEHIEEWRKERPKWLVKLFFYRIKQALYRITKRELLTYFFVILGISTSTVFISYKFYYPLSDGWITYVSLLTSYVIGYPILHRLTNYYKRRNLTKLLLQELLKSMRKKNER